MNGKQTRIAGAGSRLGAFLIDIMLISVIVSAVLFACAAWILEGFDIAVLSQSPVTTIFLGYLLITVIGSCYGFICDMMFVGITAGGWVFGLKAVGRNGKPMTASQSLIRNMLKYSIDMLVGVAVIMFSNNSRSLGDRAAHTAVVAVKGKKPDMMLHQVDTSFIDRNQSERLKLTAYEYSVLKEYFLRRDEIEDKGRRVNKLLRRYLCQRLEVQPDAMDEQAMLALLLINNVE